MNKSDTNTPITQRKANGRNREREELLKMCYGRLREMIPACNSETTLIKCIEMLEKQRVANDVDDTKEKRLYAITATLDRLSELNGE